MSPSPLPCAEPPAGPAEGALSRAELVAMLHLVEGDNAELAAAAHRLAQRVDVLDHACGTGGAVTAMDEVALLRAAATARRAMVAGCRGTTSCVAVGMA